MDSETEWAAREARKYGAWLEACRQAAHVLDGEDGDKGSGGTDKRRSVTVKDIQGRTRTFRDSREIVAHVRGTVQARLVRREGWTVAEPDGRVEADTAVLVLRGTSPGVRLRAEIGLDGSLVEPALEYTDSQGTWRALEAPERAALEYAVRQVEEESTAVRR